MDKSQLEYIDDEHVKCPCCGEITHVDDLVEDVRGWPIAKECDEK